MAASSSTVVLFKTDFSEYDQLVSKISKAQQENKKSEKIIKLILKSEFSQQIVKLVKKTEIKAFRIEKKQKQVEHEDVQILFYFEKGTFKVKFLRNTVKFKVAENETIIQPS